MMKMMMTAAMRATWKAGIGALVALLMLASRSASAELRIDITKAVVEPIPVAVANFVGADTLPSQYGADIARVVTADLERSGLFKPIDPKAFIQKAQNIKTLPRFGDWRVINVQALVHGRAHIVTDGRLRVEFRLWDVLAEQQMVGLAYFTIPDNWRRVAHIIADAIYKRLTGEDGYFDTRIVYIAEQGALNRRVKRLAIMDQDGANHRFLTDGGSLVLTPRFSPTLQEITYLSFYGNVPRVYIFNIDSGRQEILGDGDGREIRRLAILLLVDGQIFGIRGGRLVGGT